MRLHHIKAVTLIQSLPEEPDTERVRRSVEGTRAAGSVDTSSLRAPVWQRETELWGHNLLDVRPTDVGQLLNLCNLENVDGAEAGTVTGSQVLVHVLNSLSTGHGAVLLVHVVSSRSRVVSNPDAEVLHLHWLLLVDL